MQTERGLTTKVGLATGVLQFDKKIPARGAHNVRLCTIRYNSYHVAAVMM